MDTVRRVDYYYTTAPDKPGEGARVLSVFRDAGVGILGKLAAAGINATASEAVCTTSGRFAGLLWVEPRDVKQAAQALGLTSQHP